MADEQTYIMIKPDGVQRGLIATIIQRFEQRGFTLRAMKMLRADTALAQKHYQALSQSNYVADKAVWVCSSATSCMHCKHTQSSHSALSL